MTNLPTDTDTTESVSLKVPMPKETLQIGEHEENEDHDDDVESHSDDSESLQADLTPNDIFGLDPLDVLTLEELAEYLKVSAAAAHRVIKEQKLPGRNIGGEWRFLRDAVANWLRCQEAPVQAQQKAREDYSKPKVAAPVDNEQERFSRPPQRPYQAEQSGGGEYRPRQRFPEGGQQYGSQGGGQYGKRGGGQYGSGQGGYGQGGSGQYGSGQYGGNQYGGGQGGAGNYGSGGSGGGGGYTPPPRRPFRAGEEGAGSYGAGTEGGYSGGGAGRPRFGGGGYSAGGQQFSGGAKRKNKRQVFDNERGKRLDRRREGEPTDGPVGSDE